MKTPPIQHKQVENPQNASLNNGSEGMSMAPPAFQLKASSDANPNVVQRAPAFLTITDGDARLRGGPPAFEELGPLIPRGTRVEVLEEGKGPNGIIYRVKDLDTGKELGWTSKGNTENLDKKYEKSQASYTYHVDGHDLIVYLPKDGLKTSNPNVFMFLHGHGGDYRTGKTRAETGTYEDNPAISGKMQEAVSNTGNIAICPTGNKFQSKKSWSAVGKGVYKNMVDMTLTRLTKDLGMAKTPLTAGSLSITGHSAGGGGLGQAALDTEANDVTLQEAGYNFTGSWNKLRDWFLTGKAPKTMRLITVKGSGGTSTSRPVQSGGHFSSSQIVNYSKQLASKGKLEGAVKVEEFEGDPKVVESGGMVLKRGYRVLQSDGTLQGSLRIYEMAESDPKNGHWMASSKTMETSMTSGETDRKADQEWMKKR